MAGKLMNELILAINGAADRDLVFDPFDVIDLLDECDEDSDVGIAPYAATYWNHMMINVYKVSRSFGVHFTETRPPPSVLESPFFSLEPMLLV